MIEPTDEMRDVFLATQLFELGRGASEAHAVRRALAAVLALVERDYRVSKRKGPLAPPCADEGPDGHRCERNPHSKGRHAASGIGPRAGELVLW